MIKIFKFERIVKVFFFESSVLKFTEKFKNLEKFNVTFELAESNNKGQKILENDSLDIIFCNFSIYSDNCFSLKKKIPFFVFSDTKKSDYPSATANSITYFPSFDLESIFSEIYKKLFFDKDHRFLLESTGLDDPTLSSIINQFSDFFPSQLNEIEKAGNDKDSDSLQSLSHSLKSNLGFLGSEKNFNDAYSFEIRGKNGNFENFLEDFRNFKISVYELGEKLSLIKNLL